MNKIKNYRLWKILPLALLILTLTGAAFAQTTAFPYQGYLTDSGLPPSGTYQLQFKLFDAPSGGNQIGATVTDVTTTVTKNAFVVLLDFGAAPFETTENRYLEISVRRNANDTYTVTTPRQQIYSTPFAIRSLSAAKADTATIATTATNATNAENATNATYAAMATNATNATTATSATTANTATTAGNVTGVVAIANGGTGSATKNFVDLTTAQMVAGDKTFSGATTFFSGNVRTNGLLRVGNETGVFNLPRIHFDPAQYVGLVIRRINGVGRDAGGMIAQTDFLRLERDGTNGGWQITNRALNVGYETVQSVNCLATNSAGAVVPARIQLSGNAAGTTQLYTDSQNIEYMQCSFGSPFGQGHLTQIVLQRAPGTASWVGTVTSTFNQ